MHRSSVGNLLNLLPRPPWTQPLDWDLGMNWGGEKRVFFPAYVRHRDGNNTSNPSPTEFSSFERLPTELQLRILSCCSIPTLWQLMRTSSMLRIESSKLFWGHPDASFLMSGHWIIGGGYPGRTCLDLTFLAYVQNVEIEYSCLHYWLWPKQEAKASFRLEDVQQDIVAGFWSKLKKRCPAAKRVVFNQNLMLCDVMEEVEKVPLCLEVLLRASPKDIVAEAVIMQTRGEGENWKTDLYSYREKPQWRNVYFRPLGDGGWEYLDATTRNNTVLVPGRLFRGLVGQFEKDSFVLDRIIFQERAFWPLVIEALDRHHFDNGKSNAFECPKPECSVRFTKAGEWTIHAATTSHGCARAGDDLFDILPTELRGVFKDRYNMLMIKRQELSEVYTKISKDWNEGGEKRKRMQQEIFQQLENDPDWATDEPAADHRIWKNFTKVMDPTWNGQ